MTAPLPLTLSIPRVAELLGVSRNHAYRSVARDEIPTIQLGQRKLVPLAWVADQLGVEPTDLQETT